MTEDQNPTPHMLQNRINIIRFLDTYEDESADDIMSRMMTFEAELSQVTAGLLEELEKRRNPAKLVPHFEAAIEIIIAMGADDLVDITRRALEAINSGDRPAATARVLEWLNVAAETRATNIALFQACQLFGHALNGKPLPEGDDQDVDDGDIFT